MFLSGRPHGRGFDYWHLLQNEVSNLRFRFDPNLILPQEKNYVYRDHLGVQVQQF